MSQSHYTAKWLSWHYSKEAVVNYTKLIRTNNIQKWRME